MNIDAERDFHGYTAAGMRAELEAVWASGRWRGLRRVRVIHGRGEVLGPVFLEWCDEVGIRWAPEPGNPGATFLYPAISDVAPPPAPPARRRTRRPSRITRPEVHVSAEDTALFEQVVDEIAHDPVGTILRRKRGR